MAIDGPTNPLTAWCELRRLLHRRRLEMGLRQEDVARMGAFALRTLERWENGDSEPPGFALFRWCSVLGVVLTPSVVTNTAPAREPAPITVGG
ncbi:helix-turn-helix domain-containing protein [Azospirillum picis]|uniref:Transcriptional regulator with XRE-family HTH domain n=1 Tax=Azospirillum picis TaxID=488438 RepID=A0ABU0MRW0_9PROT|nr:helix-turn-helix transcriptional regulator [Azospirillum picis]MBP2302541.1 transcriptional regulator with XRE-family HTH domain [Azospirillum picis]MDQ0536217.1 transcriptional regulator with XRE-family HTH domain [Azospirillum picis]